MIDIPPLDPAADKNRRYFVRLSVSTPVHIWLDNGQSVGEGRVTDLSPGGVRFVLNQRLDVDSELAIEIEPGHHPDFEHPIEALKGRVRVLRVEGETAPFTVAARFTELS